MRRSIILLGALALAATSVWAESAPSPTLERITNANRQGQVVFLLLTQGDAAGLAEARTLVAAANGRVAGSAVVELDRAVAENADVVSTYRLQAAPVPLVLVIAQNGVAVGAVRPGDKGALDRLIQLVPSPKKAEYFQLLAQKRIALIAFSRPDMQEQGPLFEALSAVNRTLQERAGLVLVDLGDEAEAKFLAEWKVPADATRPVLHVVNAKGQPLGRLDGAASAEEILKVVNRKAPCCADPGCEGCK